MPVAFFTEYRVTGVLLILSFIVFAVGAGLPFIGAKGDTTIYELTAPGNLQAVAASPTLWRWGNACMGGAILLLLQGRRSDNQRGRNLADARPRWVTEAISVMHCRSATS